MVALLAVALYGMGHVKKAFFTASNTPMFYVDLWLPQGTDIRTTRWPRSRRSKPMYCSMTRCALSPPPWGERRVSS